jgi:hypothetical protein
MQHDNSTKFCKTEIEREMDMAVISQLMDLCRDLADNLEDVHDSAYVGEIGSVEVEYWDEVRNYLLKKVHESFSWD